MTNKKFKFATILMIIHRAIMEAENFSPALTILLESKDVLYFEYVDQ